MHKIDEHERRLFAALSRIGAAAERLAEAPPAAETHTDEAPDSAAEVEVARLTRALADAQDHNATLTDRLRELQGRHGATVTMLETRLAGLTQENDTQGNELHRLRMVNVQLREALRSLREALTAGAADAGQINRAMQAEIETMRAARQIEAAGLDRLLAALEPHLAGAEAAMQQTVADADDAASPSAADEPAPAAVPQQLADATQSEPAPETAPEAPTVTLDPEDPDARA